MQNNSLYPLNKSSHINNINTSSIHKTIHNITSTTTNTNSIQQQQQQQIHQSLPSSNNYILNLKANPSNSLLSNATDGNQLNNQKQLQQQQQQPKKLQQQQRQQQKYNGNFHSCNKNNQNTSYVNAFTEFVIKNSPVQIFEPCTKIANSHLPAYNRRGNQINNQINNNSNNNNNNNNDNPSSTIICNSHRRRGKNSVKINTNNNNNNNVRPNILNGKNVLTATTTATNTNAAISSSNITTNNLINNNNNDINSINNANILALASRNMQVLLKHRKPTMTTTATTAANQIYVFENQNNEKQHSHTNDNVQLCKTGKILRKFRLPKTTALFSKSMPCNNSISNINNQNADDCILNAPTPPPTIGTPNSTTSSMSYLEEVIETVDDDDEDNDDDDDNNEVATNNGTNTVIIEGPLSKQEEIEGDTLEFNEGTHYLTDDTLITTTAAAAPNITGLERVSSSSNNSVLIHGGENNNNHNHGQNTPAPLQLQTIQPNGAITCINLPPNTILLSAADGTILATTAPAAHSKFGVTTGDQMPQQQQLIALQDWPASATSNNNNHNNNGHSNSNNLGISGMPHNATTMLLTSNGTAIPILQQSMAAAAAANELLKTQVLA